MKKYYRVFLLYLQELTEYRFNLVGQSLMWFIPLIGLYYVWQTIYSRQELFGSYNREQMITYYLLISFLSGMIQSSSYWPISQEIERGELTKYILRPVSYVFYHFSLNVARRFTRIVVLLTLIVFLRFFLPGIFVLPTASYMFAFIVSVVFGFIMYYLIAVLIGFTAFWLVRAAGLVVSLEMLSMFLSGLFIPLDLLPEFFEKMSSLLPFQYGLYFSVKVFLTEFTTSQIITGLFMQIFWIAVLVSLLRCMWSGGLKSYESVGI